jgi:hypothetical protein
MNEVEIVTQKFKELKDDVLDSFNEGEITKNEMINILKWCEKMERIKKEEFKN